MGECTQRRRDRGTTRGRRNADGLANGVGRPRGTRGRPTPPPHHAVASSKGNAPAWAGAAARYRTRPPSRGIGRSAPSGNAGGDSGIHDYPQAVLRPHAGTGSRRSPEGSAPRGANARRSLHKPLPHLNLSSASRRQAQCVPRAPCLQGPGHERTETQKAVRTRIARQDRPLTVHAHS